MKMMISMKILEYECLSCRQRPDIEREKGLKLITLLTFHGLLGDKILDFRKMWRRFNSGTVQIGLRERGSSGAMWKTGHIPQVTISSIARPPVVGSIRRGLKHWQKEYENKGYSQPINGHGIAPNCHGFSHFRIRTWGLLPWWLDKHYD